MCFFFIFSVVKKYALLFIALIIVSCSDYDEKEFPFYVAENGVTIKARDWVTVGTTAPINAQGVAYIKNLKGAPEWDKVNYISVEIKPKSSIQKLEDAQKIMKEGAGIMLEMIDNFKVYF